MLLGLWKCTFDDTNPESCHLYHTRLKLGFPERGDYHDWYLWVKSLSDKEAEDIYEKHMVCLTCKKKVMDSLK
jgi:hypothetical protein